MSVEARLPQITVLCTGGRCRVPGLALTSLEPDWPGDFEGVGFPGSMRAPQPVPDPALLLWNELLVLPGILLPPNPWLPG